MELKDFKPVALEDRDLFWEHYERFPQTHSEYLYTSILSWKEYLPAYYLFSEGCLVIMQEKDGVRQFRPPIGERNESVLKEVCELAMEKGGDRPLIAIDEERKEWIEKTYPEARIIADRDFYDYVYRAGDLADLPGKNYVTHRNQLSQFKRKYEYTIERISPHDLREVDAFLSEWCLWRDCENDPMLEAEKNAILFCVKNFQALGLSGITLRIEGEIKALSVYEKMNQDTAVIHFEKGMPEYKGVYPTIINEAAKILSERYIYINRESDLGRPGLRTAKTRLHPHHMVKLYYIERSPDARSRC